MRVMSSIVALVAFLGMWVAPLVWRDLAPPSHSRDEVAETLSYVFAVSGAIAAFLAIILASDRKAIAVGFAVYAMLHGSIFLYFSWRMSVSAGPLPILAGLAICVGLRAVMMLRKKCDNVDLPVENRRTTELPLEQLRS